MDLTAVIGILVYFINYKCNCSLLPVHFVHSAHPSMCYPLLNLNLPTPQVLNSVSLHQIKKQSGASLRQWLELEHGPPTSEGFLRAQNNFVESAAAYALTSYLLQLKDRSVI